MNIKTTTILFGVLVAGLGITGLLSGEGRLTDGMNIDLMLDSARILLGGMLIIAGLSTANAARTALGIFGVAYLGMFLAGLISPNLFGMTPSGLGWIDQMLHLGGGILGLALPLLLAPSRGRRLAV